MKKILNKQIYNREYYFKYYFPFYIGLYVISFENIHNKICFYLFHLFFL